MRDALGEKESSHIFSNLKLAHPECIAQDWNNKFRLEVESAHRTTFERQLAEAVRQKNTSSVLMNNKDEYVRCLVPDIPLQDRAWVMGAPGD